MNITKQQPRAQAMITKELTVQFNTPAFLGNAEQSAQWRTPPFKHLLREWWRIAVAKRFHYDYHEIREAEARLFGHAWLEGDRDSNGKNISARKSLVRLRLDDWSKGSLENNQWPGGEFEKVTTTRDGKGKVRADLYTGFGAVLPPSKKEHRKQIELSTNALNTSQTTTLRMGFPQQDMETMTSALFLINQFGTLGRRSRNGWGSIRLGEEQALTPEALAPFSHPLEQCLALDWPHAIGTDDDLLVWQTRPEKNWYKILSILAHIKVGIRWEAKNFVSPQKPFGGIHLLGYPAGGKWELRTFGKDARLAAQLRFKVLKTSEGYVGAVFHLPTTLPPSLRKKLQREQTNWLEQNELAVWRNIHKYLDNETRLKRCG